MANKEETNVNVGTTDLAKLIEAVHKTALAAEANAPVKKVSYAKREPNTPFTKGKTRGQRAKLKFVFYQNGYHPNPKNLFDEEIELINQLKPGKFANNIVTVRKVDSGNAEPDAIHIMYPNRTADQRLAIKNEFRNLYDMLKRCVDEAEALSAMKATA